MASGSDSGKPGTRTPGSPPTLICGGDRGGQSRPRGLDVVYAKIDHGRLEEIFRRVLETLPPEEADISFREFVRRIHSLYVQDLPVHKHPKEDSFYSMFMSAKEGPMFELTNEFRARKKAFLDDIRPSEETVTYSLVIEKPQEFFELQFLHQSWKGSGGELGGYSGTSPKELLAKIFQGESIVTGEEGAVLWSPRWGYIDLRRLNRFSENYFGPVGQLEFVRDLSIVLGKFVGMTNFYRSAGQVLVTQKGWHSLSLRWPQYYWLSRHAAFDRYSNKSGRRRFIVDHLEGSDSRFDPLCRFLLEQKGEGLRNVPPGFVIPERPPSPPAGGLPPPITHYRAREGFQALGLGRLLWREVPSKPGVAPRSKDVSRSKPKKS